MRSTSVGQAKNKRTGQEVALKAMCKLGSQVSYDQNSQMYGLMGITTAHGPSKRDRLAGDQELKISSGPSDLVENMCWKRLAQDAQGRGDAQGEASASALEECWWIPSVGRERVGVRRTPISIIFPLKPPSVLARHALGQGIASKMSRCFAMRLASTRHRMEDIHNSQETIVMMT